MKLIIIGAGGNSRVIADIAKSQRKNGRRESGVQECELIGFLDDNEEKREFCGLPVLGKMKEIRRLADQGYCFVNGIGDNQIRRKLMCDFHDVMYVSLIHSSAIIGNDVEIGEGTVVMPGAVINAGSIIGRGVIINTGAVVEHENRIGDFVHLASGTVTAGNVTVGEGAMLGTGTRVIQGIVIGEWCTLGAGAVVVSDIPDRVTAVGVPARVIGERTLEK